VPINIEVEPVMTVKAIPAARRVGPLRAREPILARASAVIIGLSVLSGIIGWLLMEHTARDAVYTQRVQIALFRLASAAHDADSAQWEFLATVSPAARDKLAGTHAIVDRLIVTLSTLTADQPTQRARIKRIGELLASDRAAALAATGTAASHNLSVQRWMPTERQGLLLEASEHENARFMDAASSATFGRAASILATFGLLILAVRLSQFNRRRERSTGIRLGRNGRHLHATNIALQRQITERMEDLEFERIRAERERVGAEGLLRDVTHRVGNNLALVVSFLNLHIRLATSPETINVLTSARQRVHAIAITQRRLNVIDDLELTRIDTLLKSVLAELVEPSTSNCIKINVRIRPLLAEARSATTVCVLTQELVMNALKHAFPTGAGGWVTIVLDTDGAGGAVLEVSDSGQGTSLNIVDAGGLGTKIVKLLAAQYDGHIAHHPREALGRDAGTRVVVTLPSLKLIPDGDVLLA
jgi:two-component sensor histidine kinase